MAKKSQGLPIHVIILLILGIIVLAIVLMYIFGVIGKANEGAQKMWNIGSNIIESSSESI